MQDSVSLLTVLRGLFYVSHLSGKFQAGIASLQETYTFGWLVRLTRTGNVVRGRMLSKTIISINFAGNYVFVGRPALASPAERVEVSDNQSDLATGSICATLHLILRYVPIKSSAFNVNLYSDTLVNVNIMYGVVKSEITHGAARKRHPHRKSYSSLVLLTLTKVVCYQYRCECTVYSLVPICHFSFASLSNYL